ncbi:hypothetical protein A2U01_0033953, partial [Trifolium medium]|nr:hypothetical protein [Trifolium medium]
HIRPLELLHNNVEKRTLLLLVLLAPPPSQIQAERVQPTERRIQHGALPSALS